MSSRNATESTPPNSTSSSAPWARCVEGPGRASGIRRRIRNQEAFSPREGGNLFDGLEQSVEVHRLGQMHIVPGPAAPVAVLFRSKAADGDAADWTIGP